MLKRTLSLLLVLFVANLALPPSTFANTKNDKETEFIEKLQASLHKQGVGIDSKIKVKLNDGTKLKGYVSEINDDKFVVVNEKTGQNVSVAYPQVKQAQGNNWNTRKTIRIAATIGLVVIAIAIIVALKNDR